MVAAAAVKSMELALLVELVVADADVARAHVDADAAPQLPHAGVDVDVDVALQLPHADADVDVAPQQLPHADADVDVDVALQLPHADADVDVAPQQLPHADADVDVDVALQLPHADADVDVAPQLPHADAAHVVAGPAMLAPVKCFVPCTLRSFFVFSQSFSRQVLHFHSLTSCCY